ncbi:MarR family transcriptional regulator [Metaplanococcus flavidus]|uniref:Replication/maintenance protein RepL n=1 Tax=Metaplanococcus flavidus TaxID=569883 RepID=A0ABW3LC36_9BACL
MAISESRKMGSESLTEIKAGEICRDCFASESERIAETGEMFIDYFVKNASEDGVLFKTIKEITSDNNIPHQTLSKVLKILEEKKFIYRRNGIIGLTKNTRLKN